MSVASLGSDRVIQNKVSTAYGTNEDCGTGTVAVPFFPLHARNIQNTRDLL